MVSQQEVTSPKASARRLYHIPNRISPLADITWGQQREKYWKRRILLVASTIQALLGHKFLCDVYSGICCTDSEK